MAATGKSLYIGPAAQKSPSGQEEEEEDPFVWRARSARRERGYIPRSLPMLPTQAVSESEDETRANGARC